MCMCIHIYGLPGGSVVKNLPPNAGDRKRGFSPCVRKIPWRRKCQLTPVFLPGESYEQRRLVGYSPWSLKESDTTEHKDTHHIIHIYTH